ncbi:cell division protein FtsQ/DivIB [Ramlibacter rhizophilus]|uniref:Cell division protein FtsQ n=1 Tax=Ramlibacter rhizophilus TaxID=1781167 RepID=A0A4Z0BNW4_9BURK|nr:cell division protein FtsQ/DivIB [Ramlibacter rhizophilus]TFY99734.1 FtsQ-type POTRA domain-containing protein [Ramlibacter rhizophilus]
MRTRAAPVVPMDVRLMNATAMLLFAAVALMAVAALGTWALRHPLFSLGHITVAGDVAHSSASTLRANVAPRLAGNFFTVDLAQVRQAFVDVPWVRQAVVRRAFPNGLRVVLEEHQPVALWGADGDATLVNSHGEVFEANVGEIDVEALPRLSGPASQSAAVLATYRVLAPLFQGIELPIEQLTLTGRGSWQVVLDSGAKVELGRGSTEEVQARAQRFVLTITQAAGRYGRRPEALVAADLRHADGYAIRLRGVSTVGADAQQKK